MIFIETQVFTGAIAEFLDDEQFRFLQLALLLRPDLGPVIPRSGGLRKMRWSLKGGGKRGGIRVIYFWQAASDTIYLLYAYKKSAKDDLTARQVRLLANLVREEFE